MHNEEDRLVGSHKESGENVYQCARTGLLYFYGVPQKNYISLHNVALGSIRPQQRRQQSSDF